jgi:hypothetical protein
MGNMGVRHHQNIISDAGFITFPAGTAYGDALTENAAVTDDRMASFSLKFQILRHASDGSAREKLTVFADRGVWMNHYMRTHNATIPQYHVMFNYCIRTNYYIFTNLRAFFNDRGFMYLA